MVSGVRRTAYGFSHVIACLPAMARAVLCLLWRAHLLWDPFWQWVVRDELEYVWVPGPIDHDSLHLCAR